MICMQYDTLLTVGHSVDTVEITDGEQKAVTVDAFSFSGMQLP